MRTAHTAIYAYTHIPNLTTIVIKRLEGLVISRYCPANFRNYFKLHCTHTANLERKQRRIYKWQSLIAACTSVHVIEDIRDPRSGQTTLEPTNLSFDEDGQLGKARDAVKLPADRWWWD